MTAHRGRVTCPQFGPGTVVSQEQLDHGYVTVEFDNGERWNVGVHFLDPWTDPPKPAAPDDPTFLQRLNDDDLEALGAEWAERCDPCDDGGPGYCSCPPDKARDVVARLVTEVKRLRIIEAAQLPRAEGNGAVAAVTDLPWVLTAALWVLLAALAALALLLAAAVMTMTIQRAPAPVVKLPYRVIRWGEYWKVTGPDADENWNSREAAQDYADHYNGAWLREQQEER